MNLTDLLPAPASVAVADGVFDLNKAHGVQAGPGTDFIVERIEATYRIFGLEANIGTALAPPLGAEAWKMVIDSERIVLSGGDRAGLFYGAAALKQLLALACAEGAETAQIPCGTISDAPRFHYRGFLLDSARRFQPLSRIREVIRLMAEMRLNYLHWHLVDDQGWRCQSAHAPELAAISPGFYRKDELREIADYAAAHFITIIPELEMPGHSGGILSLHPELACNPAAPGSEFCLGSAHARQFLQAMLLELLEIFPDSPIIHLGGDEAVSTAWANCPRCRDAMRELSLDNVRDLESHFMRDMCRFILDRGRTPMVWSTHSAMQPEVIVQIWNSIHELAGIHQHGNRIVNSVHYNYYLDYPATGTDPMLNWMPAVPEETIYLAEPYFHREETVGPKLLGPEACLWTEIVPEWRVMPKLRDRIFAFAETAWSPVSKRGWHDYLRRKSQLRDTGYFDLL